VNWFKKLEEKMYGSPSEQQERPRWLGMGIGFTVGLVLYTVAAGLHTLI
jgi:hypothetical protein